jgi:hypothetical protein
MHLRYWTALLVFSSLLIAQTDRGNISGTVSDATAAAVAGASVVVTERATNRVLNVESTNTGDFNVANLSPGTYRLEISAPGFKRFVRDNIVVTAATTVRVDAILELGQVTETVEVSTNIAQVQTENAKISTAVQNKLVDELPLVVGGALRSPFDLVSITAETRGSGTQMALGGGQARAWEATMDGISVTTNRSADAVEIAYNAPSLEAITEFTVDTNGFKAEYGQAGGGIMTFSSKSGTNEFHGVAYNFLRNEKLDARGFFAGQRSVYKQNDFGATVGGPVMIPKLYNGRNRTFFFLAYEGFRIRQGANDTIRTVPTPEMYEGDFSNWVDQQNRLLLIYDPATTRPNPAGSGFIRDPFANNRVPQSRFSALSRALMPFGQAVRPNRGGQPGTIDYIRNNFITTTGTLQEPQDKGSAKIDHNFSEAHRLGFFMNFTRYRREVGPGGPPGLPQPLWDGQVQAFDSDIYRLTYDWTISPRMLNHFSIGGNMFDKASFSPNMGQDWAKQGICFKNSVDCNVNFPGVQFTEFSTWGGVSLNGTQQPLWSLKEDLSYIRGTHTFKFGYAFQSQRAYGYGQQDISGRAWFSFLSTSIPGATSFNSGSSFASFLLGEAIQGRTETDRFVAQLYRYHGFYAQDDWRISKRLTLNLGVRYEFTLPPVELKDQYSDFTPDRPNPAVNGFPGALRFAGFGPGRENRRSLVPGWYKGIGPRVGLAYTVNDKTVFRTAFGRSFSKVTVVTGSGHFAGFIGQYVFQNTDQGVTRLFNWDDGLPAYPLPPQLDPAFSNNNDVDYWQPYDAVRAPENLYWTASIQRQLSSNTVLELAYNANVGTHLQTGLVNLNQVPTRYLNEFIARYGATEALNLLRANITSAQARAAGIPIPYANFTDPSVQSSRSVNQALRPFPQFLNVVTSREGDKSGHSSYHAFVIKAERRYSQGLTFQWNYTLSKLLTDADSYDTGGSASQDQYNRRLEKSIGRFDQTHSLKLSTIYELPFGRGRKWLNSGGLVNAILGGWRVGAIQTYMSGFPLPLTRNNPFPIFNGVTRPVVDSYDNWRAPLAGDKFDPNVDRFYDRSAFPAQPNDRFGNVTRFNPKVRQFPMFNENVSFAKSFPITESKRIDLRWELFNMFNRTVFGSPNGNLNSNVFGVVQSQANNPRQMQAALKLYW